MSDKTLGQVAYEAWSGRWKQNPSVVPLTPWVDSDDYTRSAWQAAAQAVAREAWAEGCSVGSYAQEAWLQDVDDLVNPYEALQEVE